MLTAFQFLTRAFGGRIGRRRRGRGRTGALRGSGRVAAGGGGRGSGTDVRVHVGRGRLETVADIEVLAVLLLLECHYVLGVHHREREVHQISGRGFDFGWIFVYCSIFRDSQKETACRVTSECEEYDCSSVVSGVRVHVQERPGI